MFPGESGLWCTGSCAVTCTKLIRCYSKTRLANLYEYAHICSAFHDFSYCNHSFCGALHVFVEVNLREIILILVVSQHRRRFSVPLSFGCSEASLLADYSSPPTFFQRKSVLQRDNFAKLNKTGCEKVNRKNAKIAIYFVCRKTRTLKNSFSRAIVFRF